MELLFQTETVAYLDHPLQAIQRQEVVGEAIVPDSYPDILSVVDTYAEPILRGKECQEGSVTISGGIKGGLIYMPDDQSAARTLDFYLPYTLKFDSHALNTQSQVLCSVRIRSVDGSILNSRKAMLRVNLCVMAAGYHAAAAELPSVKDPPSSLQLRQNTYDLQLPLETFEKSFEIQDEWELPSSLAPIRQICKLRSVVLVRDLKLIGDKAVYKGTVECKLLYWGEDNQFHTCKKSIPFSQYCDLQAAYDRDDLELWPVLTGYDWNSETEADCRHLELTLHILMQGLVSGTRRLCLTEDAYCIGSHLKPQWTSYPFQPRLDQCSISQTIRKSLNVKYESLIDADTYADFPDCRTDGDTAEITQSVQFHTMGYTAESVLEGISEKSAFTKELSVCNTCQAFPLPTILCRTDYSLMPDSAELNCDLNIQIAVVSRQELRSLSAAVIEPEEHAPIRQPSLILRKIRVGTSVWQLAKEYGTLAQAIQEANSLEQDILNETKMLLIPMV